MSKKNLLLSRKYVVYKNGGSRSIPKWLDIILYNKAWDFKNFSFLKIILLFPILGGFLAPLFYKLKLYRLSEFFYHFFSLICHQLSTRSFWIAGAPMGICARCTGVYVGLFCASLGYSQWRGKISIIFFCYLL